MDPEVVAQRGLDGLATQLYRIAAGDAPAGAFPIRLVQDPETVRAILMDHAAFPKNYDFLSAFAEGRFSANGEDWAARVRLTQPSYARNIVRFDDATVEHIYRKHLRAHAADRDGEGRDGLYGAFVGAALEVVSGVFGLARPIAWDQDWLIRVRGLLALRQWIAFAGAQTAAFDDVQRRLAALRREILDLWAADADLQALLAALAGRGRDIPGFDAGEELIQNIIASSETTASSLMWAAQVLAGRPALAVAIRDHRGDGGRGLEAFIAELLRLFPPVPFVTRFSRDRRTIGGESFAAGEPLAISFVGLHCDPGRWDRPFDFDPARPQWAAASPPAGYFPFSTGARVCGGMKIARLELRAGLRALVDGFDIRPGGGSSQVTYGLSLRPAASPVLTLT
ncbi:cytochrome P450 [Caulobacter sp. AP07]|uniref:cytochrome P450 n=1 Tax=Caulobacter sp. AP07 TaxID=1144304 RepID=UPI000271D9AD|nr:cytochrome P450 [Caulobacter sp. AP07]EJL36297.1 cytochrome P450 [Caulobacter sp. AP07]